MWEARATYEDGTEICQLFESNPYKGERQEQYELEEWLLSRHDNCTWYSVDWVYED